MKKNRILNITAILLAISPILDPYVLLEVSSFSIRILDIPLIILFFVHLINFRFKPFANKYLFLLLSFSTLTLIAGLSVISNIYLFISIRYLVITIIYSVLIMNLFNNFNLQTFYKVAVNIGLITTVFLFIQFIFVSAGYLNFFDGRIPFWQLSKYDGWAGLVDGLGNIRVHSFFQEPSYYAIYTLPLLAYSLFSRKNIYAFLFFIGLIISSSLLAFISAAVIIVLFVYNKFKRSKYRLNINFVLVFTLLIVVSSIMVLSVEQVNIIFNHAFERIENVFLELTSYGMTSNKLRLLGNIGIFDYYPWFSKVVGLGAAQYPIHFSYLHVYSYSSTFVTILLDYGLVGLTLFLLWIVYIVKKTKKEYRIYVYILITICFVDHFWFNWYFYYLSAFFMHASINKKKANIDLESSTGVK